ncbi:MAG: sigma 54-interacting transcriptional regulator [Deltaproteobacteria bacterium]|nr:sigma 54-interacting transcriptional regulator [Deltaproteobacteria bacterium]
MPRQKLALIDFLRADAGRLGEFLDTVGDALFAVDREQTIVFWNRRAEELTGYRAAEVMGQHCLKGIRCVDCLYTCALQGGEGGPRRVELRRKDGRSLSVLKRAYVLTGEAGEPIGGVEWLRDESELVGQVQQCQLQSRTLAERERLQAAVLGSIREGVIAVDRDWRITSFSRRAEEITGFEAERVMGRACREVIGSALCREDCPARHCLESGDDEAERSTQIETADGRSLSVTELAVPLRDESGEILGSVLVIEDRTLLGGQAGRSAQLAGMIGQSEAMRAVFRLLEQVARNDVTVLITGESGTGKEMVARALHGLSARRAKPFQAINCAALPETLLESELFGHVRGAFTGALRDRAGRIEEAEGGTVLLDEVGELSPAVQAKLLRFLQDREYQRLGESRNRSADVRILAATNRDLARAVAEGDFREDLYYRIRVIPIALPPLRQRRDDIPLLAAHLLERIGKQRGRPALGLTPAALQRLARHDWPGNVRELANALEYAVALSPGRRIRPEDLPAELAGARAPRYAARIDEAEEVERIRQALAGCGGKRTRAARQLGMDRVTLYRKMKRFGIRWPE